MYAVDVGNFRHREAIIIQKWEYCIVNVYAVDRGFLAVSYASPKGHKRQKQDFKKGLEVQDAFDALMVKMLGEGWEPLGDNYFRHPYQGS